ncbi:hypothetical protein AKO1_009361 [Acrasis kona]|uniref:Uncharacterized protein n=1 Tax=Acrasis kona TaxID=1008807 RepID=A0AAW2ZL59_9EUKA
MRPCSTLSRSTTSNSSTSEHDIEYEQEEEYWYERNLDNIEQIFKNKVLRSEKYKQEMLTYCKHTKTTEILLLYDFIQEWLASEDRRPRQLIFISRSFFSGNLNLDELLHQQMTKFCSILEHDDEKYDDDVATYLIRWLEKNVIAQLMSIFVASMIRPEPVQKRRLTDDPRELQRQDSYYTTKWQSFKNVLRRKREVHCQ